MSTTEIFVTIYIVSIGIAALYYSRKIHREIKKQDR
jgi:hypothetical protein